MRWFLLLMMLFIFGIGIEGELNEIAGALKSGCAQQQARPAEVADDNA